LDNRAFHIFNLRCSHQPNNFTSALTSALAVNFTGPLARSIANIPANNLPNSLPSKP
jgi:hypothetical protein